MNSFVRDYTDRFNQLCSDKDSEGLQKLEEEIRELRNTQLREKVQSLDFYYCATCEDKNRSAKDYWDNLNESEKTDTYWKDNYMVNFSEAEIYFDDQLKKNGYDFGTGQTCE